MNRKRVLGLVLACLLLAREGLADTLVLRDGTRLEGTVANREQLKAHPERQATISIVTGEPGALRRVLAQEVEYLVLEDADGRLVIDPSTLHASAPASPSPIVAAQSPEARKVAAHNFLLCGLAVTITGAAVKFGTDTHAFGIQENAYNATNYAMWAAGGVLMAIGFIKLADSERGPDAVETGPSLSLAVDRGSLGVGAGWRLGF